MSSPPYAQSNQDYATGWSFIAAKNRKPERRGFQQNASYGQHPAQLGNLPPGSVDACLSSPPYANSAKGGGPIDFTKVLPHRGGGMPSDHATPGCQGWVPMGYGDSPAQLGNLPPGSIDACLSSPPYADRCTNDNQRTLARDGLQQGHNEGDGQTYGHQPGQLAALPTGAVEAVVSSPPYAGSANCGSGIDFSKVQPHHGGGLPSAAPTVGCQGWSPMRYGDSDGQLGIAQGDTFWHASKQILEQVFAVLKPNGVAIWVVKAYCRDGQIVDFPGDWRKLAESCGFVTLHEHHALLVEHHGTQRQLFGEEDTEHKTKRVSFFRRLHEAKRPDLAIDHETIYCMVKPHVGLPPDEVGQQMPLVECCVSSPPYNLPMSQDHNGTRGGNRGTQPSEAGAFVRYGNTPGQLEGLPPGNIDVVVSSPPYAASLNDTTDRIDWSKAEGGRRDRTKETAFGRHGIGGIASQAYGATPGQLGAMATGHAPSLVPQTTPEGRA